jgi:hypothetical protein
MLTIYIVWGTTYLAIRVVVDPDQGMAIPPFAMVFIRFAVAGLAMLALVAIFARDALRSLTRAQIRDQAIVGIALNVGGLGVTSFGEQTIPSGITALLIALLPIWVAVIGRVVYKDHIAPLSILGPRPSRTRLHPLQSTQLGCRLHLESAPRGNARRLSSCRSHSNALRLRGRCNRCHPARRVEQGGVRIARQ